MSNVEVTLKCSYCNKPGKWLSVGDTISLESNEANRLMKKEYATIVRKATPAQRQPKGKTEE